jgi:hypothetical protein
LFTENLLTLIFVDDLDSNEDDNNFAAHGDADGSDDSDAIPEFGLDSDGDEVVEVTPMVSNYLLISCDKPYLTSIPKQQKKRKQPTSRRKDDEQPAKKQWGGILQTETERQVSITGN